MTVAELIKELEKIEDKTLDVVADIGLDDWDRPMEEVLDQVYETEVSYGKWESGVWIEKIRKCVKIIGII